MRFPNDLFACHQNDKMVSERCLYECDICNRKTTWRVLNPYTPVCSTECLETFYTRGGLDGDERTTDGADTGTPTASSSTDCSAEAEDGEDQDGEDSFGCSRDKRMVDCGGFGGGVAGLEGKCEGDLNEELEGCDFAVVA